MSIDIFEYITHPFYPCRSLSQLGPTSSMFPLTEAQAHQAQQPFPRRHHYLAMVIVEVEDEAEAEAAHLRFLLPAPSW